MLYMYKTKDKSFYKLIKKSILLSIFLLCLTIGINVSAHEHRTVRVAFFPMDGYHIVNADGSYGGMDVEYLEEVARYTSWNIEYVA